MKKLILLATVLAVGMYVVAAKWDNCTAMLSADLTATANTTTSAVATARAIDTMNMASAALYLYAISTSGATGNVTFYLERSPDGGTTWAKLSPIAVALTGTTAVSTGATLDLDLSTTRTLRLNSVANADATHDATVNAYIQWAK